MVNLLLTVVTLANVNKSIGQAILGALAGVFRSLIESGLLQDIPEKINDNTLSCQFFLSYELKFRNFT